MEKDLLRAFDSESELRIRLKAHGRLSGKVFIIFKSKAYVGYVWRWRISITKEAYVRKVKERQNSFFFCMIFQSIKMSSRKQENCSFRALGYFFVLVLTWKVYFHFNVHALSFCGNWATLKGYKLSRGDRSDFHHDNGLDVAMWWNEFLSIDCECWN